MIQDLHTKIDRLKERIKLCERVTLGSLVGIYVFVKFGRQEWVGLLFLILFCQVSELVFKRRLKQEEYLVKGVEERTQEIRSEKDAIQEESGKLAAALEALGEAQDELIRKERMAAVRQLTQGLVDRILNPLNYISNFANLTSGLAKDLRENLNGQKEHLEPDVYDDSVDLLNMATCNLKKISEHGFNTVRIIKAVEKLLKDRRDGLTLTNISGLCRIALDKLKKTYEQDIQEKNIRIVFGNLTLSLMVEVSVEQSSKVLAGILKNSMYALLKRSEAVTFSSEIFLGLKASKDMLETVVRGNGSDIDRNIKGKIFAPFFTTKTTGETTGVGLYLCHEIVQNHRGAIEVESKKRECTQFLITIPVYQLKTIIPPKEEG